MSDPVDELFRLAEQGATVRSVGLNTRREGSGYGLSEAFELGMDRQYFRKSHKRKARILDEDE